MSGDAIGGVDGEGRPRQGPGSWRLRRRFLYLVNLFCAGVVAYVLWRGLDTGPAEAAVTMSFLVMGASVGSYVFGATWEDINARRI